jgi:polyisoprenoid-binding protein YceI
MEDGMMRSLWMKAMTGSLLAWAVLMSAEAAPTTYHIDPVHSRINFYVNHLGFSNSVGQFHVPAADIVFDNAQWSNSKVDLLIAVKSLEMGDATWNEHILSDNWLDEKAFPTMHFVATKLEGSNGTGSLTGNLTIKGVTHPVTLAVHLNGAGEHMMRRVQAVGFTATTTIKRSDYGIKTYLGPVGDDITIRIEIEAAADQ